MHWAEYFFLLSLSSSSPSLMNKGEKRVNKKSFSSSSHDDSKQTSTREREREYPAKAEKDVQRNYTTLQLLHLSFRPSVVPLYGRDIRSAPLV